MAVLSCRIFRNVCGCEKECSEIVDDAWLLLVCCAFCSDYNRICAELTSAPAAACADAAADCGAGGHALSGNDCADGEPDEHPGSGGDGARDDSCEGGGSGAAVSAVASWNPFAEGAN